MIKKSDKTVINNTLYIHLRNGRLFIKKLYFELFDCEFNADTATPQSSLKFTLVNRTLLVIITHQENIKSFSSNFAVPFCMTYCESHGIYGLS